MSRTVKVLKKGSCVIRLWTSACRKFSDAQQASTTDRNVAFLLERGMQEETIDGLISRDVPLNLVCQTVDFFFEQKVPRKEIFQAARRWPLLFQEKTIRASSLTLLNQGLKLPTIFSNLQYLKEDSDVPRALETFQDAGLRSSDIRTLVYRYPMVLAELHEFDVPKILKTFRENNFDEDLFAKMFRRDPLAFKRLNFSNIPHLIKLLQERCFTKEEVQELFRLSPKILNADLELLQSKMELLCRNAQLKGKELPTILLQIPQVLSYSNQQNLQIKFDFLKSEFLLKSQDLRIWILQTPKLLTWSLEQLWKDRIGYLKEYFQVNASMFLVIPGFLTYLPGNPSQILKSKFEILSNALGLSKSHQFQLFLSSYHVLSVKMPQLEENIQYLQQQTKMRPSQLGCFISKYPVLLSNPKELKNLNITSFLVNLD